MSRTRRAQQIEPAPTPLARPLAGGRSIALGTVFLTGASVLVLEIAGSRVVAPLYGTGLYSWSALISVTLAALSLGYWAGGRTADRRPDTAVFHGVVLVAGLLVIAIPWVARFVLRLTEPLDPRLGVLVSSTLLFFPALALLGSLTPFAIRLTRPSEGEVGGASGLVFAVSTVGSLLAALATGFLLIPNLGVRAILMLTGVALVLTAAAGLFASRRAGRAGVALLLAALALASWRGADAAGTAGRLRVLARMPSFFGFLRVVETDALRILTVNGIGQNYVSLETGAKPTAYVGFIGALPRLQTAAPRRPSALVIGLGAGELADRLEASGASVTAVEIDPRVEQAARRYFGLALPHERVHIEDGRVFLERDTHTYDFVVLDAFVGEDVAGHLCTLEALQAIRRRLAPGGLLAINYTSLPGGRDARSLARTLRATFPQVRVLNDGAAPTVLASNVFLASARPIELDGAGDPDVSSAGLFLANEARLADAGATLLTDDYNPINTYRLGATRLWRDAMIRMLGRNEAYWTDF